MKKTRAPIERTFYTKAEVAQLLGVDPTTVRRMADDGRLPKPSIRIGNLLRWSVKDINKALGIDQPANSPGGTS
jgi:excisionase family DNA binding protein